MKQQPDRLFQQKLEPLNIAPSAAAWDKIEKNLDRKTYPVWLWKVAAGFVLISVVGVVLLTQQSTDSSTVTVNESMNETLSNAPANNPEVLAVDTSTHVSSTPVEKQKAPKAKTTKPQQKQSKPLKITEPLLAITEVEQPVEVSSSTVSETLVMVTPEEVTADVTPVASTAIVYSVEEVNQKFLLPNNTSQATSDEKKSSTFQKLLAKVHDLKTNEDPMGKLRQKKNEILALNFNKEKREQNN